MQPFTLAAIFRPDLSFKKMKTLLRISRPTLLAAFMVMFAATAFGQAKQKREISGVRELSVSNAFAVEIRVGNQESLEIEIDEDYMDDVITEVRGGRLTIKMRDQSGRRSYRMRETPRAYLTVKSLESISASGAVSIKTMQTLESNKMSIDISGASSLSLDLDIDDLNLEVSGSCVINLKGRADRQTVRITGASTYSAYDLQNKIADLRISGASNARVNVSERLEANVSGASSVRYRGSASVDSDTSGASSVRKGE